MASHKRCLGFAMGCLAVTSGVAVSPLYALSPQVIANVAVTNPADISRDNEPLFILLKTIGVAELDSRIASLYVVAKDRVVSSQTIDTDGDGKIDSLIIIDNYAAHATHQLSIVSDPALVQPAIKKQTQAEVSIKEGGQWDNKIYKGGHFVNVQHVNPPPQYTDHSNFIRYEGPGIESDKVAYRIYLDQRNGFDIFGKKIPDMVLQNVGHDDGESYENDAPWGLDIFKVGDSLGTGGFGYWNGKKVESVAVTDSRVASIVANGNFYSAFDIRYNRWHVNHGVCEMSAMISMNAGSRLAHTQVRMQAIDGRVLPAMAIGVVRHPNTKLIQSPADSKLEWAYVASWGKQSRIGPDENLGIGVLFQRNQRVLQTEDDTSYVSVINASKGLLDYYFLAAWDHEPDGIKTEAEFTAYLDREVMRLSVPLDAMIAKPHNQRIH